MTDEELQLLSLEEKSSIKDFADRGSLYYLKLYSRLINLEELKKTFNNEIEKTEGEIKVLQAKLELLKEMDKHKSSAEKAYCAVYGEYPRSCARWNGFLTGYDLGYIHGTESKNKFVPHQEHFGLKLEN